MTDLDHILPLWKELRLSGTPYVLATVVEVEGSGYRKPGARMMISADGRRAGTISGGCLEGEVARKAFWHTSDGPVMRRYSTSPEDGDVPFGMGCGGVVHVLLERPDTAGPMLERLAAHNAQRTPLAIVTVLERDSTGKRAFWPPVGSEASDGSDAFEELAQQGYGEQSSFTSAVALNGREPVRVRVEWNAPRPALFVFGAGDDAIPLVSLARQLGWYVSVADGRSNLATQARFPDAHEVHVLSAGAPLDLDLRPTDAAVILTHSLEQDTRILAALLDEDLAYIGVLGPRRRTAEILATLAEGSFRQSSRSEAQIHAWVQSRMEGLHAPMGLDLGGDTPTDVAISVIAEIQQTRHRRTGLPLRQVRARGVELKRASA
jgi:xanthine/CO dehydrogenase XdhC/CoxF family maturation factor